MSQHRLAPRWLTLGYFGLLAALALWPLPLHLLSAAPALPGDQAQDLYEKLWNLWWFRTALGRGVNPFFTDALFYPTGASLLFHPLSPSSALLSLPFQLLGGPLLAYNAVVLLSYLLSGLALAWLARAHGCGWLAAAIGGTAYALCSFHLFHTRLSHLELVSIQWLPLYALALDRLLLRRARPGTAIALAALLLLTTIFTSLYLALYAALLTVVWALLPAARPDAPAELGAAQRLARLAALAGVTLLVAGPLLLWPMWQETRRADYIAPPVSAAASRAIARLDPLLPPSTHPLRRLTTLPQSASDGVFLGGVPLLLAAVGVFGSPRRSARWVALALLAYLLALGPALPLYRAVSALPLVGSGRYPDRFLLLAQLAVALLAALGAERVVGTRWALGTSPRRNEETKVTKESESPAAERPAATDSPAATNRPAAESRGLDFPRPPMRPEQGQPAQAGLGQLARRLGVRAEGRGAEPSNLRIRAGRPLPVLIGVALLALTFFELHPGVAPLLTPPRNPVYALLAAQPGPGSVVELPISRNNSAWLAMAAQTQHQRPILDGALARPVPRTVFRRLPLFRELERPDAQPEIIVMSASARAAALRAFGLGYLVYHRADGRGPVTPPDAAALTRISGVPVTEIYRDPALVAFRLAPPDGPARLPTVITLGEGWYDLERTPRGVQRWVRAAGGALTIEAPQATTLRLRLRAVAFGRPRPLAIELDQVRVGTLLVPDTEIELYTPALTLAPGVRTLRLVPLEPGDAPGGGDDRALTVAVAEVEGER